MEAPKGNVIDLRKIKRKTDEPVPQSFPVTKEKAQIEKIINTRIGIIPLLVIGLIDVILVVYFALSNNYLASFFFFLAAIVGAFGLFKKKLL